jgi:carbamoyltransferase
LIGEDYLTMNILGINAYHGDSSACLIIDGQIVAAAEEERFKRIKHWAGLPLDSIRYCLAFANISIADIDHIAINRNPSANLFQKALFAFSKRPSYHMIKNRLKNAGKISDIKIILCDSLKIAPSSIKARVWNVEHHRAHLASSFFVSPFKEAVVVSVDGFGDFVSTMWGFGKDSDLVVDDQVLFPHSLGLFYLAITQYLGFPYYGDEYKVMGLAPYGNPTEMDKMHKIVHLKPKGKFELNLDYFLHHSEGVSMTWDDGSPTIGQVFSDRMEKLLGPAREKEGSITERHQNIAASLQEMYEEVFFHILAHAHRGTGNRCLALSGGCAMNSVANGKIFERSPFRELYVQSAAGDGGGAIGAAYYVWNKEMGMPRSFVMEHAYWGPEFSNSDIEWILKEKETEIVLIGCMLSRIDDMEELCGKTASMIAEGKVVGWFQGRMEWGPRALGNRSIVCDPRRTDMKEILNLKIKRRESFRPFAPSILRESVSEWFETDYDVPFMLQVYQIKKDKRHVIPAVTHVNGSGRLQTITEQQNPCYYRLIKSFEKITDVPIVLNTSFNENEPVVCTPDEALDCFLRTQMDVLVMGNWFIERKI